MSRQPRPKIEFAEVWACSTCGDQEPGRSKADLIEHLKGFHGLASPLKGNRSLVMHLDEGAAYHSTYEWSFQAAPLQAVKAFQYQSGPRHAR